MTDTITECSDCLSPDLDIVFSHDCPNDPRYNGQIQGALAKSGDYMDNSQFPKGNGNGSGNGTRSRVSNKATDKQIAYMLALGVPEHIANAATKHAASEHIARYKELRDSESGNAATGNIDNASDKQISYIESLLSQREHTFTGAYAIDVASLNKREASDLIGKLKALPMANADSSYTDKAKTDSTESDVSVGFYVDSRDTVYKVQLSQRGYLYAKILCEDSFEYSKGAIAALRSKLRNGDAERLSIERAAAYGHATGRCMCCGRTLKNKDSISAGIGPICAGKL